MRQAWKVLYFRMLLSCSAFIFSGVWKKRWGPLMFPLYVVPDSPRGWKCSVTTWPRQCVLIPTQGWRGRCLQLSVGDRPWGCRTPRKVSMGSLSPKVFILPQRHTSPVPPCPIPLFIFTFLSCLTVLLLHKKRGLLPMSPTCPALVGWRERNEVCLIKLLITHFAMGRKLRWALSLRISHIGCKESVLEDKKGKDTDGSREECGRGLSGMTERLLGGWTKPWLCGGWLIIR